MFLFTTPESQTRPVTVNARKDVPSHLNAAIQKGSKLTGVDFDYLASTAQRESGFNVSAKARTSSATGLFQVIDQTWLGLIKAEGHKYGLSEQAQAISARPDGTLTVENPFLRKDILDLRLDPDIASVMVGALTQKNRNLLASEIGREPKASDLYAAHFLGAGGAADLIRNAQRNPHAPAASAFPEAASANRSIFFDKSGQPRSFGEVYNLLAASHGDKTVIQERSEALAFQKNQSDKPAFHGFFQTDIRSNAVSNSVMELWRSRGKGQGVQMASAQPFFPRSDASYVSATAQVSDKGVKSLIEKSSNAPISGTSKSSIHSSPPLDLGAFMKTRGQS